MSKLKEVYLSEAQDHIQHLNDGLLKLEKNTGNVDILNELMRSSHTIKGSSAAMGYKKLAYLTHVMEDIFDLARKDLVKISPKMINVLFKTVDLLERSLENIKKTDAESDTDSEAEKLKKLTGVTTEGIEKSTKVSEAVKPSAEPAIQEKAQVVGAAAEAMAVEAKVDYIKVPVKRLDTLMDLMEELVIDKMKLEQDKKKYPDIAKNIDHLNLLISDLQYQVMQVHLVPLDQVFARFPRMIRDMAESQNKKIEFQTVGGDIELDRTIVDKLNEPILHLLRNAIDHGIEKEGTITLKAVREKNHVCVSVEDNGRGIDYELVRKKAVERGYASEKEASSLTDEQLNFMLFLPQMSTREVVSETAGRGVGLSVVKKFVDETRGVVLVESARSGSGTRFSLELPLTIAIMNALLTQTGQHQHAIPFPNIERTVLFRNDNVKTVGDQETLIVDGLNMPLVRLGGVFHTQNQTKENTSQYAVLVKRGNTRAALCVEKILDQQEIIIKPLPTMFHGIKGLSGSSILGDGTVILVVDVGSLLDENVN